MEDRDNIERKIFGKIDSFTDSFWKKRRKINTTKCDEYIYQLEFNTNEAIKLKKKYFNGPDKKIIQNFYALSKHYWDTILEEEYEHPAFADLGKFKKLLGVEKNNKLGIVDVPLATYRIAVLQILFPEVQTLSDPLCEMYADFKSQMAEFKKKNNEARRHLTEVRNFVRKYSELDEVDEKIKSKLDEIIKDQKIPLEKVKEKINNFQNNMYKLTNERFYNLKKHLNWGWKKYEEVWRKENKVAEMITYPQIKSLIGSSAFSSINMDLSEIYDFMFENVEGYGNYHYKKAEAVAERLISKSRTNAMSDEERIFYLKSPFKNKFMDVYIKKYNETRQIPIEQTKRAELYKHPATIIKYLQEEKKVNFRA